LASRLKDWVKNIVAVLLLLNLLLASNTSYGYLLTNESLSKSTISDIQSAVCTWKDNKAAALSLTYDDGLASHVDLAVPLMHEMGLLGTFNIVIANVGIPYGADWDEWQIVADMGHEIASHSINHPDLTTVSSEQLWREVVLSKTFIEQNLTGIRCQSFCYPGGAYNQNVINLIDNHYVGARAAPEGQQAPENPSPSNSYAIIPVLFGMNQQITDMNQLIKDTVEIGGWLVEMIHAIGNEGYEPVSLTTFTSHLEYIHERQEDVWVAPFNHVIKYIQERDSVTPVLTHISDLSFSLRLESFLNATVYDEPLTVKISVPADWFDVDVVVGGKVFHIHTDAEYGCRSFLLDLQLNASTLFAKSKPPSLLIALIVVFLVAMIVLVISLRQYWPRFAAHIQ
jgi:peptidoglycan/xylan/chitin deacetylase (PgdA/CDA1 family)